VFGIVPETCWVDLGSGWMYEDVSVSLILI
jgi:hypothetical protein